MSSPNPARIGKYLHDQTRAAFDVTKKCYMLGCDKPPIGAHSVTNNRLLTAIADDGHVIYFNAAKLRDDGRPQLIETGRNKATVFPGFCDDHDKIFEPIDNHDYTCGKKEQEYLFALRASAREYTTRSAMVHQHQRLLDDLKAGRVDPGLGQIRSDAAEQMDLFGVGFKKGLQDLQSDREFFNATWNRQRFWKIDTEIIEIEQQLPLVACGAFNLEFDPSGTRVNDLSNMSARMRPCYFTVFPQGGKTYALLSWHHSDAYSYSGVVGVSEWPEQQKKVAVSNLLTGYVENFAANPTYWRSLPADVSRRFDQYFGTSMLTAHLPFIYDDAFSLFDEPPVT